MPVHKMTVSEALKVLGLPPGCSEQEASAAFFIYAEKWQRRLFAGDARRQAVARRKIQLGNSAFRALTVANFGTSHVAGDYTLGSIGDDRVRSAHVPQRSPKEDDVVGRESNRLATNDDEDCDTSNAATLGLPHYAAATVCCLVLLIAGAIWAGSRIIGSHDSPSAMATTAHVTRPPGTSSVAQPTAAVSQLAKPATEETTQDKSAADTPVYEDEHTFFLGSTPAQVARAQGAPTKVDGDTWYFGSPPTQSTVTFRGEKVVEWNSDPKARLRVSGLPGKKLAGWPSSFTIGSHKTAVAAIQGAPDRVAGDVWFFGDQPFRSRVTFKDDRVVTWENNPAERLNVDVPTPSNAQLPGHAAYSQAVKAMYAIGGSADPELSNELFQQSANQGHPGACVELGLIYIHGNGSIAGGQWDKADGWFRKAAQTASIQGRLNNPAAMFAYALLLIRGVEEERNPLAACEWLHQSGRMDHVPSLIRLGRTLDDSAASPETNAFRTAIFRRALELDAAVGGVELASLLMATQTPQQGSSEVTALLEAAAGRNLANAHHRIAHALQEGWAVVSDADGRPKDQARSSEVAYQYLLKAFRLNRHDSFSHAKCIAICLFNGNGVLKNAQEGMKYMKIACDSNPWAMMEFGDMIYNGDHLQKDEKTAATWYRRAFEQFVEHARRGDLSATLKAAQGYEEGFVTNQDLQEARRLYRAAASSVNASTKRAAIDKLLEYGDPVEGDALIPPF